MQVTDLVVESVSQYPDVSKNGPEHRMYTRQQAKRFKLRKTEPLPLDTYPQVDNNTNPKGSFQHNNEKQKTDQSSIEQMTLSKFAIPKLKGGESSTLLDCTANKKVIRPTTIPKAQHSQISISSSSICSSSLSSYSSQASKDHKSRRSNPVQEKGFSIDQTKNEHEENRFIHFPRPLTNYSKTNRNLASLWCYQVGMIHRHSKSYNFDSYNKSPKSLDHWWKVDDFDILEKPIGTGKFGTVYRCVENQTNRVFAMKSLDKGQVLRNGNALELLRREVEIQSRLDHINILKLFGYFHDSLSVNLLMEFSSQGSLFEYQSSSVGRFSFKDASRYICQVLNALSYLNSNDIFHRDLKPENLLIFGQNKQTIKICDFGWSVICKCHQYWRNTLCGTSEYVAKEMISFGPEESKGSELPSLYSNDDWRKQIQYDVRYIDIWQCGILAFELVRGFSPFYLTTKKFKQMQKKTYFRDKNDAVFDMIRRSTSIIQNDLHHCSIEDVLFQDFVSQLTRQNPIDRMSASDALSHEWIKQYQYQNISSS